MSTSNKHNTFFRSATYASIKGRKPGYDARYLIITFTTGKKSFVRYYPVAVGISAAPSLRGIRISSPNLLGLRCSYTLNKDTSQYDFEKSFIALNKMLLAHYKLEYMGSDRSIDDLTSYSTERKMDKHFGGDRSHYEYKMVKLL